jgi:site-specific DNA-methyltransferase (adenine-specific)
MLHKTIVCKKPHIEIILADCTELMLGMSIKEYDLAIVDPPYGIGITGDMISKRSKKKISHRSRNVYKPVEVIHYTKKKWDVKPNKEYWEELFRISKNQIVWGGNHFELPLSTGWVFWDKVMPKEANFSDGELAWTSFKKGISKIVFPWAGFVKGETTTRIHPTQKPIGLYEWLIRKYAKEGDKIIDTHLGSGSSCIAAYKYNHSFTGIEADEEYYEKAIKRIEKFIKNYQKPIFNLRTLH